MPHSRMTLEVITYASYVRVYLYDAYVRMHTDICGKSVSALASEQKCSQWRI